MSEDRRVRKTKNSIKTTLIKMLETKSLTEITVTDLTEKADISRKTFYIHYNSIFDAADDIDNDICKSIQNIIDSLSKSMKDSDVHQFFYEINKEIINKPELVEYFAFSSNNTEIKDKVSKLLKNAIAERIDNKNQDKEVVADFLIGGMITAYINWCKNRTVSCDRLMELMYKLCSSSKTLLY